MELRGFHVVWYHDQKDKKARGIGVLEDLPIKDYGL